VLGGEPLGITGILIFSGYSLDAIRAMAQGPSILASIDAVIAGPYIEAKHCRHGLLGSANQKIHLRTDRYHWTDFAETPRCEAILHRDGSVTLSGINPLRSTVR
jgi:anaerobic ribonucleoside-triphosphate reductase activating protein